MDFTGERVIPKLMRPDNQLLLEHQARYGFATEFVNGRVLDIACGVGYGAEILLAEAGNRIHGYVGVDVDSASVQYAIENYWNSPKVDFLEGDALDKNLKSKIGMFDTIISFETVEHLSDDYGFVENLYTLLNSEGKAIISTPFGQGRGKPCGCEFHYHQYLEEEFFDILSCFNNVKMYYQRNQIIERNKLQDKKYYLMVAICEK
ncbi:2-polyprenyl-3-methyl-5-hydroxy-6-metoxy-1,4-benzoquinol methylase [Desulfitispora alkaliphila]|uniref:class I SAM-dependent methyltransferase n=1 Tax=Desulfitispora alkaliphila TaxID=622674 RepID=UPI003D1AC669